jgi:CxxC-x17-CxxC domain-containing protein
MVHSRHQQGVDIERHTNTPSHRFSARKVRWGRTRRSSFLNGQDKTLVCADCNQEFAFTASEQQFYADRQFSEPRRCPSCRAAKKAARGDSGGGGGYSDRGHSGGGYSSGPREMFSATCSSCGREAQVPFRPSGAKPVYCSDCFSSQRGSSSRSSY